MILFVLLLLSSLYLVRVAYDARRLFAELDRVQAEERVLASDFERLKSERQAQATPLRVEKTARDKLGMRTATPAVTHYVEYAPPASAPAATSRTTP
jgi:cell division protein FtsL